MIQGMYTAASGMLAVETRQSAIANNISNSQTIGYKGHTPVEKGFYQVFKREAGRPFEFNVDPAPAGGVTVTEMFTDFQEGIMRNAETPLGAALQGPGFFVIDTPYGERYTRSGDFTMDMGGRLVTRNGFPVQSETGRPLDVRGNMITISNDGTVHVDGEVRGRLRVLEFEDPQQLERKGGNLYSASEEVLEQSAAATQTEVKQHLLEMANVNMPREMTRLMLGMRAYETNQRVIQTFDTTMGRVIEQVGMPT